MTVRDIRITALATAALRRSSPSIFIENSSDVALWNTTVFDSRPGTTAALEIAPSVASGDRGGRASGLKASLAPGASLVNDRPALPGDRSTASGPPPT